MNKGVILTVTIVISALMLSFIAFPLSATAQAPDFIPGRYIVVLDNGISPQDVIRGHGVVPDFVYSHALNGFSAPISPKILNELKQDPRVVHIEQDQKVYAFSQTLPTGIDRIDAELNSIANIDGFDERVDVDIAILDTGIKSGHEDLYIYQKTNCAKRGPFGGDCKDGDGDDGNGHGTHVAGTAAAIDNGIGVVGVAPGAKLWAVKVLGNDGSGWMSWIIGGVDYVTAHADEIEVASMSLGCKCESQALEDAITNSINNGVVYVVAAGNSYDDVSKFSPAQYDAVITVSALADFDGQAGALAAPTCKNDVGGDDEFATFSNFGAGVDIIAPGVCILSTWNDGGYYTISGTSMATPHVTGAVALYLSMNDKPTNAQGVAAVEDAIVDMGTKFDELEGYDPLNDGDTIREPLLNAEAISPAIQTSDFTISSSNSEVTLTAESSNNSITITVSSLNDFTGRVLLSTSAPLGITAVLDLTSIDLTTTNPSGESILTITVDPDTSAGTFDVVVTGDYDGGTLTHSTTVTVNVQTEPNAPQDLRATAGNGEVTLSWKASSSVGGTEITNYKIYRGTSSESETHHATVGNVLAFTDDIEIANDQEYFYKVTAVNLVGESDFSNEDSATPSESATPTVSVVDPLVYGSEGGKNKDKHLLVTIYLTDETNPVSGATVSIELMFDNNKNGETDVGDTFVARGSGTTGSDGFVTFSLKNAPSGCYTTNITGVVVSGFDWDEITPNNNFGLRDTCELN